MDEQTPLEDRVDYVKAYQELSNAYEALVTYDDYNNEMDQSKAMQEQVSILKEQAGVYETVKGSLVDVDEKDEDEAPDFSDIAFYSDNSTKLYDIDAAYIDQLLGTYAANSADVREEIEKALQKLNKTEVVKEVYREILNAIDHDNIDQSEDIFAIKRQFFTDQKNEVIDAFGTTWHVSVNELHASAIQYVYGMEPIPNVKSIIESKDYDAYKEQNPDVKPFKYPQMMKRAWRKVLDEQVVPLDNELK
jgi:type I restriction enzyme R subunit